MDALVRSHLELAAEEIVLDISGTVKWFDPSKGYGFVQHTGLGGDVMVHVRTLRLSGFETALDGATVACKAVRREKGLQAFQIISMDESTATRPAQLSPPRVRELVTPTSGLERAQVKWFDRLRGFGFVTLGEGTPDIFVHMEILRRFGMTELRPGQYVQVRYGPGSKGRAACEIHPDARAS